MEEVKEAEGGAEAREDSRGEGGVGDEASPSAQAPLTWTGDPAESLSRVMSWRRRRRWFNTLSSLARSSTKLKMR